jgi:TolA-binding protein
MHFAFSHWKIPGIPGFAWFPAMPARGMADCRPFRKGAEEERCILTFFSRIPHIQKTAFRLVRAGLWIPALSFALASVQPVPSSIPRDRGSAAESEGVRYTLRLKNEDFMRMAVPREKYLLGLVRSVTEEVKARRFTGDELSRLGIDALMSPKQLLLNAYIEEINRIYGLTGEISALETKARRKVDWQVLEALAVLRKQVAALLESSYTVPFDSAGADQAESRSKPEAAPVPGAGPDSSKAGRPVPREFAETLMDQWKYNHLLDGKLTQTRFELIRAKLIRSAGPVELRRMFQRDLRAALESYNAGDFALSRLQLRDVIAAYPSVQTVDDILFYAAESSFGLNFLDEALETYRELASRYPVSPYSAKALSKMIFIHHTYGQTDSMVQAFQRLRQFQRTAPAQNVLDDETFGVSAYLVGLAEFNREDFGRAMTAFDQVPGAASYKPFAEYLTAACQSNLKNDDEALALYTRLAGPSAKKDRDPIEVQVRNNSLMKMGLIYYERGDNATATSLFRRVDKEFQSRDLNLLGKAWSAYRSGKPVEALENAEVLLKNSLFSNYLYEAKVLAARSKELMGQSDQAVMDLEQVRSAGTSPLSDRWSSPGAARSTDGEPPEDAGPGGATRLFSEANRIFDFLHEAEGPVRSASSADDGPAETVRLLDGKITVLDSLERLAEQRKSQFYLNNIRKLRGSAIQTLELHGRSASADVLRSAEDPIIRRMGLSSYLRYLFITLLDEAVTEKRRIRSAIGELERMRDGPRSPEQDGLQIRMEIRREELVDTWEKLNQYEVWLRENMPQAFHVEIDRWANFSEYGISNINFSRIREIDGQISELSGAVRQIDRVYQAKKADLGRRIEALLEDVTLIEKQMQAESQKKNEMEKDKRFDSEYYEKSSRESPLSQPESKPETGGSLRP